MANKKTKKKSKRPIEKIKEGLITLLKAWAFIAGVILIGPVLVILVSALFESAEALLILTTICLTVATLYFFIKAKDKSAAKICIGVGIMNVVIFLLALNDIPMFLRKIPGEVFIGTWAGFSAVTIVAGFILGTIIAGGYIAFNVKKAKNMVYTDSDLMVLQDFDRFRLAGYYVLKAKLYNIIKIKKTRKDKAKSIVRLNDASIIKEDYDMYISENPQVGEIVDLIKSAKKVGISDIIKTIEPKIAITSAGGKYANFVKKMSFGIFSFFTWSPVVTALCFLLAKHYMGMMNDKPVNYIVVMWGIMLFVTTGVHYLSKYIHDLLYSNLLVKPLVKFKSENYRDIKSILKNADSGWSEISSADAEKILRAYALYNYKSSDYKENDYLAESRTLFGEVIFSVATARILHNINIKYKDGDGCSSCSSCGGCGGGCGGCGGGCGGCGD